MMGRWKHLFVYIHENGYRKYSKILLYNCTEEIWHLMNYTYFLDFLKNSIKIVNFVKPRL